MASTKHQLKTLAESVSKYGPDQPVEWRVGKVANALTEQAKKEQQNSAVLDAIDPFGDAGNGYIAEVKAAGVRTIILQAAEAVPGPAPRIGIA